MLTLHSPELLADALKLLSLGPDLREVLARRIEQTLALDLGGLTHLLVIEPGDTEADIVGEVCFSPLENTLLNTRLGSPDFEPDWAWHEDHGGIHELVFTVGDGGFAFLFIIPEADGIDAQLIELCRYQPERHQH
jgi:hypothetical protein